MCCQSIVTNAKFGKATISCHFRQSYLTLNLTDRASAGIDPPVTTVGQTVGRLPSSVGTGVTDGRPKLNSENFPITYAGQQWTIRVQDVEGLVDIYLGSPEALARYRLTPMC